MKTYFSLFSEKASVIFITFFCIGILFLSSCGRIHCPGFPDHLKDYLPYKKGEIFSFVNQNNDTLSFWISDANISKKHTMERDNDCNDCCASPGSSFTAHRLLSKSLAKELGIVYEKEAGGGLIGYCQGSMSIACDCQDGSNTSIRFEIVDYYWDLDYTSPGKSKFSLLELSGKDPYDPNNSSLFGEIVVIEDEMQNINKVTIVKGKGITGFYDQKHDFQWRIIKK